MVKQIITSILWTVILFIILATIKFIIGEDNWLIDTINWVIPSAVGFFLGYGYARIQKN